MRIIKQRTWACRVQKVINFGQTAPSISSTLQPITDQDLTFSFPLHSLYVTASKDIYEMNSKKISSVSFWKPTP